LPGDIAPGAVIDVDDVDVLVGATAEAIEHLVPAPQRFGLVGFSFGGIIAGRATIRLGSRVALLALIGAGGLGLVGAGDALPLRAVRPDADWAGRAAAHRHNLTTLMLADERSADELAIVLHDANVSRSRFRLGQVPASSTLVEVLGSIGAPLLWITGERDAYSSGVEDERRRVVMGARPDAELVEVPGAGHWAAYEAPDVVNPLLVDRLGQALPPDLEQR
jgi:pimeloyl-ACP methyl ester carboxylesterase